MFLAGLLLTCVGCSGQADAARTGEACIRYMPRTLPPAAIAENSLHCYIKESANRWMLPADDSDSIVHTSGWLYPSGLALAARAGLDCTTVESIRVCQTDWNYRQPLLARS